MYGIQEILKCYSSFLVAFYEHIHLGPNQLLRKFLSFSSRYKDLIQAYLNWEIIIAYWEESVLSEVLVNKCGLFQKQLRVGVVAAVQWLGNWKISHHLSLETVSIFQPATKFLHNEYRLPYAAHIPCLKDNHLPNLEKYESNGQILKKANILKSKFQSHL